jgi:hypothetical protein
MLNYEKRNIVEVVFWLVTPCNLVVENQRFGSRAAFIFRDEIRDQGT